MGKAADAYIAMTIKVTDSDAYNGPISAKHKAELVSTAITSLFRAAGTEVAVWASVYGDDEKAAVARLLEVTS